MLLYAHVVHQFIWILYAIPILIVAGAIIRSTMAQRRHEEDPER
jgi:hypothetical protein